MAQYEIEFSYSLREGSTMLLDMEPMLDDEEKELIALNEIKQSYDDVTDIEITRIVQLNG